MKTKDIMIFTELISNVDKIHTTPLGVLRIKKNLCFETDDVIKWCKEKIKDKNSRIARKGKNWYVNIDDCVITVNANSYTIITVHKIK
jgi:capsule polysaccharide export protein KpsC/LpsZ